MIRATQSLTLLRHLTSNYFNNLFGSKFRSISFESKLEGVQNGCIANIYYELNSKIVQKKYFVKTHQHHSSSIYADGIIDSREIFIYIFLSKFNRCGYFIGPEEIHYFSNHLNPFDDFYIATKDVEFKTFEKLAEMPNFIQMFKIDNNYSNGILLADLISKLFFLSDTTNNPSNFGYTKDLKLKIVDFQISEDNLEVKDMLSRFLTDNFSLTNKFELQEYFYMKIDKKKELAENFFKQLDINEMLDDSRLETSKVLDTNFSKHFKELEKYKKMVSKLNSYLDIVKENFEKFSIAFKG